MREEAHVRAGGCKISVKLFSQYIINLSSTMNLGVGLQRPLGTHTQAPATACGQGAQEATTPLGRGEASGGARRRWRFNAPVRARPRPVSPGLHRQPLADAARLAERRRAERGRRAHDASAAACDVGLRRAAAGWPRTSRGVACAQRTTLCPRMQRSAHLASTHFDLNFAPRWRLLRWPSRRVGRPRPRPGAFPRLSQSLRPCWEPRHPAGAPSKAPAAG